MSTPTRNSPRPPRADGKDRFTRDQRRAILGASVGNTIEFYDFTVYGVLAVYIGQHFFPEAEPSVQLLSSFAVFGLAFLARPIGSIILGPLADRIGRKPVLIMALSGIALASFGIGILPTYETIGILAPIALVALRFLQGLSAGGEYGSGSTFMAEYSPRGRRGLGVVWIVVSTTAGVLLGTLTVTGLTLVMGTAGMADWGWRIPFILALPLGLIGWYIRQKIDESPEFQMMEATEQKTKSPLTESLKMWQNMLIIFGIGAMHATAYYSVFTYMPTYIGVVNGHGQEIALVSNIVTGLVSIGVIIAAAIWSDRVGRKTVLLVGAGTYVLIAWPAYAIVPMLNAWGAIGVHILLGASVAVFMGASAVIMTELFPAKIRASGMSLGYNIPAAVFGGGAPFVATFLIAQTGITSSAAWYVMAIAVLALVSATVLNPKKHLYDDSELAEEYEKVIAEEQSDGSLQHVVVDADGDRVSADGAAGAAGVPGTEAGAGSPVDVPPRLEAEVEQALEDVDVSRRRALD